MHRMDNFQLVAVLKECHIEGNRAKMMEAVELLRGRKYQNLDELLAKLPPSKFALHQTSA